MYTFSSYEFPLQNYVSLPGCSFGGDNMPCTLQSSWAATTLFAPLTYGVNSLALRTKNETTSRIIQGLQYLARPIDSIIQAVAMPIFTVIDHFRDLKKQAAAKNYLKIVFTPISLPLKLCASLFVSMGYIATGGIQLIIPYSTYFGIKEGKEAAFRFFYALSEIRNTHSHKLFVKPIQILSGHNEKLNPLCQRRDKLFFEIDPEFRDFDNADNLSYGYQLPMHQKFNDRIGEINALLACLESFSGDRDSKEYKDLLAQKELVNKDIEEIRLYCDKANKARENYDKIKRISEEVEPALVINQAEIIPPRPNYYVTTSTARNGSAGLFFNSQCPHCRCSKTLTVPEVNMDS